MTIDRLVSAAISGSGGTRVRSTPKRHTTKPSLGYRIKTLGYRIQKRIKKAEANAGAARAKRPRPKDSPRHRISGPQKKLAPQKFGDITSALCNVHLILTHLVGIEITQPAGVCCQAEALEGIAFETVARLEDVALLVGRRMATPKEFEEFEELLKRLSTILHRDGPDAEAQERRKLREKPKSGCDELAKTLEDLSMR